MKKIFFIMIIISSFLFSKGSNFKCNSTVSLKEQILNIILKGSNNLNYPFGKMPPLLSFGKDAEDIADYLLSDKKGEKPKDLKYCISCHGLDLKGLNGMSPDISNINQKVKDICSLESGKELFQKGEIARKFKKISLALDYYDKACSYKYIKACKASSIIYLEGLGIPVNEKKSLFYMDKLCSYNDSKSCQFIGMLLIKGDEVTKNTDKGIEYLKRACDLNINGNSCYLLGRLYLDGLYGVEKNISISLNYFEKACDLNNSEACEFINKK